MIKWKCSVCGFVMDSEEIPKKCPHCGSDPHKIKELFLRVKGWNKLFD